MKATKVDYKGNNIKITIIGKADGWQLAPLDGETWGVNDLCLRRPVKLVFQMHNLDERHRTVSLLAKETIKYVNEYKIPMVSLKKWEFIPTSIRFPLDKMHCEYFTNSISYMIAYAIYKGVMKIDIYGVNMATCGEYAHQKPNVEYWVGYARGKGLEINIHGQTVICKSVKGLYGYDILQESINNR